jgi:hypothetical protein
MALGAVAVTGMSSSVQYALAWSGTLKDKAEIVWRRSKEVARILGAMAECGIDVIRLAIPMFICDEVGRRTIYIHMRHRNCYTQVKDSKEDNGQ